MKISILYSTSFYLCSVVVLAFLPFTAVAFVFCPFSSSTTWRNHCSPLLSIDVLGLYDFGVYNIPGVDWQRPEKVNQDAWFRDEETDDGFIVVGVLDGHGKLGHELSEYFATTLASEIRKQLKPSTRMAISELEQRLEEFARWKQPSAEDNMNITVLTNVLINAFHGVHWNAMLDPDLKTGRNGATCITCLINKETKECHVAYAGDSRAIRIRDDDIAVIAEETTVDLPKERERIEKGEGTIRGGNVFYGPVGIAMTRALGDAVMLRAGVIPTPNVNSVQLHDGDALVLATDGVWDVLTNQDVRKIVDNHCNAQEAAEAIANVAKKRWVGDLPIVDEVKADDITAMVLSFNKK
jgi:serine/threonine protein phosphatase PrpC